MDILEQIRHRKQSINFQHQITPKQERLIIRVQANWRRYYNQKNYQKLMKLKKRKQFVATETLTTQRLYVEHLNFLVQTVMPSCQTLFTDKSHFQTIFGCLPKILKLHQDFLEKLEKQMKTYDHHKTILSKVFSQSLFKNHDFKNLYTSYSAKYQKAESIAKNQLLTNENFKKKLEQIGISKTHLSLESYLIKPVQRLCKYQLLLSNYLKNTPKDHIDYMGILETISIAQKYVVQTNQGVQEFLLKEKLKQLEKQNPSFFQTYVNPNRKLILEMSEVQIIDFIKDQEMTIKQLYMFNDGIMIIQDSDIQKPIFIKVNYIRALPNLKYFKNLVQIIGSSRYYTLQFKNQKKKIGFLTKASQQFIEKQKFISVKILGTENRQSIFKPYTVYIAEIRQEDKGQVKSCIYPRFKELVKVQNFLKSKNMETGIPYLHRQSPLSTYKSRTIEKRKLLIQQFLERIMNLDADNKDVQEVWQMLGIYLHNKSAKIQEKRKDSIKIMIPNMQHVNVLINSKLDKIKDVKVLIAEKIGLLNHRQFQIFEQRNKIRRLMYEDQPASKIFQEQDSILASINPFKQPVQYIFTRHFYLSNQQCYAQYKHDFVRAELQLAVIKSQILNYRLDQELMITFLCLFALYANLPLNDETRVNTYLKDLTQKQYRISIQDFRIYMAQVQEMLLHESQQFVTLPFLIIKIMGNSTLYRCQQFQVQIHHKCYKDLGRQITNLEQNIILGMKRSGILFMTNHTRHIIQSFTYDRVQIAQVHPSGIVLSVQGIITPIRLLTVQAYEISLLFQIYVKKDEENSPRDKTAK